jgi:hypothetical protein
MNKPIKMAAWTAVALLVLLQFVPVDRSNPPVTAAMSVGDGEVAEILQAACNDCHTHETTWPWYSTVAPVSMFVADHVAEGREHFNLSTWNEQDARRRDHKLEEMIEMVEEGEMPLRSYTLLHSEGRLTEEQREVLMAWARSEREKAQAEPGFSEGER